MRQYFRAGLIGMLCMVLTGDVVWGKKRLPIKSETVLISDQVQLLLDDSLVDWRVNVKEVMHPPVKCESNPVIVGDRGWEQQMVSVYGSVLYDKDRGVFRCWYLAKGTEEGLPDTPEGPVTVEYYQCYGESKDGVHWEKPAVGYKAYGPYRDTNIVINNSHSFSVLRQEDCSDPAKQYVGAGGAITGFSPDGIRWTTHPWKASGKNDTCTSVIKWKGEYLAFVRNQEVDFRPKNNLQRAVALCVSRDFEHWTTKKRIWQTDKTDGYPWVQPYTFCVTVYGDQLIAHPTLIHLDPEFKNNGKGTMDAQLLCSRDGRNWQRVANRATFLEPTADTWDEGRIMSTASSLLLKDDKVYVYYAGTQVIHGGDYKKTPPKWGIGLATLDADRFVSMEVARQGKAGFLETKLLQFEGGDLIINAQANGGDLKVELIDVNGFVIKGFDRDASRLVRQDGLRYRVLWGGRPLGEARDREPLAIRFILNDKAKLYAFRILSDGN